MQRPQPEPVTLDDILITEELSQRSPRPPNLQAENQALHTLVRQLVNQPETMLQSLVDIALDLCRAGTAGVSLLETTPNGEEIFRWTVLAGALAHFVGGTTPPNFSPCGVCLERGTPVLFSHPERYFTYFQAAKTPIVEGLVLPLIADNHALGSIWIMSHSQQRHFDAEDVRVMTSLADFTAAALLLNQRKTHQLRVKNAQLEAEVIERKQVEEALHESEARLAADLIEQRQAEIALRESESRLQAIANLVPDLLWDSEPDGSTNWYNQRWMEYTGQTFEQAIGWGWTDAIHPDDREGSARRYREAVEQGAPLRQEHRIRRHDGEYRWFVVNAFPLKDETGKVIKMYGAATDIHEARVALEALRESEEKYRALFVSMDEGYAVVEVMADDNCVWNDFLFLEVNPAFVEQTGMEYPVGRKATELLGTPNPNWAQIYGHVAETGEPIRFEEGEATLGRVFDLYVFRLGPDGSRRVAVLFTDITDRKRREANLAFLADIAEDFSRLSSVEEIIQSVGGKIGEFLKIQYCHFVFIDEDRDQVQYLYRWNDVSVPRQPDTVSLSAHVTDDFLKLVHARETVVSYNTATDPRMKGEENAKVGAGAFITVPFQKGGEWKYLFSVHDLQPREWRDDEIELVEEMANWIFPRLERARAEEALRESEQRLSVIFVQAAVGLSEISLSGHFQQVNDALCRMLERSREELVAASVPDVTHPDDLPSSLDALAQLIETGEPVSLDKRYLRPDGTILWANSILTRLDDEQGRPSNVLAVTVDLSDRKQAEEDRIQLIQEQAAREEERQRAESLAELDRAKTIFFSNVSHEFRTPLTLLLAPLQDALSDCTHPLAPPHRERLELVHRNAIRLLKLVNTLLDFSRIEARRMEAVYEPTDLAMFTTELASVFRSASERAGLRLIVDCPPLPEPVYVDREMWEKIVLNLLSNAFKFTLEGEIAVRLHPADDHHVKLQIQDTGTGIPPEELPHVFERFYQVRRTQARTHEGSGIGLALVHELIRLHGGTVDVSSTVGQGSCFTITIPLGTAHLPSVSVSESVATLGASAGRDSARRLRLDVGDSPSPFRAASPTETLRERITGTRTLASTAVGTASYVEEVERWLPEEGNGEELSTPSDSDPPQPPLKRGENLLKVPLKKGDLGGSPGLRTEPTPSPARVLLVDDNADMRDYLTRILSEHVQVEAVADGATALAAVQERSPDLVLTDVMMPGLDGFGLLKALRTNPRTREIPIILLSARAGEESVVEGLEAGADDYLIKPFSAQELVSRVNAHLQMAQLRLEALHQERALNHRKDELLSTVSHELNTPLVAILGWTRLLRANPPSPAMLVKALETIERNATLQAKLVQDLLDISRITAGKLRLRLEPVELESVIEMAIASISHLAQAKQIDLVWWGVTGQQSNPLAPGNVDRVLVQADRDRLQQIITNLLTNAVKFTPNQGSINVELSLIERHNGSDASIAEISITDTGIGISAEFLPHVFDRFRQAEESRSSKGLGLGLAIARHLVELHGGTIHAASEGVGQGATFIVRLPLIQQ